MAGWATRIAFDRQVWAAVSRNPRLSLRELAQVVNTPHYSRCAASVRRLVALGYLARASRRGLRVIVGFDRVSR